MLFSDRHAGPAETQVAELRDYPEWHRGRERFGVWIVPVEQADLLAYIAQARRQLADLLHPCPQRQPHLTVFVCGFEQPVRVESDDFTPRQLRRQHAALARDVAKARPLPLSPPDSFASAAFLPVGDAEGRLSRWRSLLQRAGREVRQAPYVPHITLGLYRRRASAVEVRARLAAIAPPPMALTATALHYATYDARDQLGPLQSHYRIAMATRD